MVFFYQLYSRYYYDDTVMDKEKHTASRFFYLDKISKHINDAGFKGFEELDDNRCEITY